MISVLFLIAGIHSTTNFKSYQQAKTSLTQQIHSFHLKNFVRKNVILLLVSVPFHLVQYANTEFMSLMTKTYSQPSQISKMEHFVEIVNS